MTKQVLKTEKLEQSYKDQLVKAGVDFQRAEQASKVLTREELLLVSEIWPEWAVVFSQVERD
jgi:ATP-dependent protease HslVU (ClpYQ) peptidase subunit